MFKQVSLASPSMALTDQIINIVDSNISEQVSLYCNCIWFSSHLECIFNSV